jgi:hypothetical protein
VGAHFTSGCKEHQGELKGKKRFLRYELETGRHATSQASHCATEKEEPLTRGTTGDFSPATWRPGPQLNLWQAISSD